MIGQQSASNEKNTSSAGKSRGLPSWMLIACGVWLVVLGFYFIVFRPALLPEDLRYIGTSLAQTRMAAPGLERWLEKVFTVLGGFMAGAGVLTIFVAAVAIPMKLKGTTWTIALSGVLTVGLMSATNFVLHSDFRWLLLVPAMTWLIGLVFHIVSTRKMVARTRSVVPTT